MRRISTPPVQLKALDCEFQLRDNSQVFYKFIVYMLLVPFVSRLQAALSSCRHS